jgi:hypothetical protein
VAASCSARKRLIVDVISAGSGGAADVLAFGGLEVLDMRFG